MSLHVLEVTPDPEVIADVTTLLEKARSGEIRGIAWVTIDSERWNSYNVAGAEARGNMQKVYFLLHWLADIILDSYRREKGEGRRL